MSSVQEKLYGTYSAYESCVPRGELVNNARWFITALKLDTISGCPAAIGLLRSCFNIALRCARQCLKLKPVISKRCICMILVKTRIARCIYSVLLDFE
jgi:hypothetical protein